MDTSNHSGLYAAFNAKDARFDGRFFVGISSTGVYCRPVCRAKRAKPENCAFFGSAAEAEHAGYRPCLLCRPELAPGGSKTDATANLAERAARLLEENCDAELHLDELAARLGCTGRHLRRAFGAEYRVSPVQYLQTCRLLLAKALLTDTGLSALDVAMAAGFGSLRRFNALFKARYGLTPGSLRRQSSGTAKPGPGVGAITLTLGYRPPYRWDALLRFFEGRAIPGVELVQDGSYARTVRLDASGDGQPICGWVRVGHLPGRNALGVTLSESLLPALPRVLARLRRQFDLGCDPDAVGRTLESMNKLRPGLFAKGTRLPGCFDAFEMTVRAVLGQQISVKAAGTLAARLVAAHGTPVRTGIDGLTHSFPTPSDILGLALDAPIQDRLGALGVTGARSATILELARAFVGGGLDFGPGAHPKEQMRRLMDMRGIGSWTAQYVAMRAMGWPDAFLETDAGVKKALETLVPDAQSAPRRLLELAEAWRPWRSYATINLWNSL